MKTVILFVALSAISALAYSVWTAEKMVQLTIREKWIVCAVDVLIRDSQIIKKETSCFLTR